MPMHSAQLEVEERPQSSLPNISILSWLCAPIPSDLAKPCKLKGNLPPVASNGTLQHIFIEKNGNMDRNNVRSCDNNRAGAGE